jgi:hypothetical protein
MSRFHKAIKHESPALLRLLLPVHAAMSKCLSETHGDIDAGHYKCAD